MQCSLQTHAIEQHAVYSYSRDHIATNCHQAASGAASMAPVLDNFTLVAIWSLFKQERNNEIDAESMKLIKQPVSLSVGPHESHLPCFCPVSNVSKQGKGAQPALVRVLQWVGEPRHCTHAATTPLPEMTAVWHRESFQIMHHL